MTDSSAPKHRRPHRLHLAPVAWISGAVAAAVLVLGASGTLSTWTAAILNNNTNTVATSNAVVLQEQVTGSNTINADCQSSNGGFSNTSTCKEIDKYGGTATPLVPGTSQSSSVTFTNIGSGPASKLILTPGTCAQTPLAGTGTPVNPASLCSASAADVQLVLACYDGATATGTAYTDLAYSGNLGAFTAAKTHTATIAKNAQVTCKFTVSLSATASPLDGGITISQPLTWELDA
ncbi:hypothetical protein [Jatrophihabitans endophyticus]|uniref:hypothetical protein n=1 Tax=Jatrophihabitans endophyticus TaxID=1206085 RepID=UPI0019F7A23B|nr:hypothetical protein [Jatrophihabitans endophyticus]MBE7189077.1 hypothetical protein [Jatrophihabitans endophyticus]